MSGCVKKNLQNPFVVNFHLHNKKPPLPPFKEVGKAFWAFWTSAPPMEFKPTTAVFIIRLYFCLTRTSVFISLEAVERHREEMIDLPTY